MRTAAVQSLRMEGRPAAAGARLDFAAPRGVPSGYLTVSEPFIPSCSWSPTVQTKSYVPGASFSVAVLVSPGPNTGVPPRSWPSRSTCRSWACEPPLRSWIRTGPEPPTTIAFGSNLYSDAVTASGLPAAAVTVLPPPPSPPPQPASATAAAPASVRVLRMRPRIICAAMRGAPLLLACLLAAAAAAVAGCGGASPDIEVPTNQAVARSGAMLFHERCGGCHTLKAADARGSKPTGQGAAGERHNGPNFDVRKETREDVLFAIRNGGFSGAIMPANVVMGKDAQAVALFLERYAGSKSPSQAQNQAPNNK